MWIEHAGIDLVQVRVVHISSENWICKHQFLYKSECRSCAHILRELNMQARSYTSQKLCTYPLGIKYAGTYPIQVRSCAHILLELNMQAHYTNFAHIFYGNWTCKHGRRGRDRDIDQSQSEARASPKQEEMEIKDKYHPKKFEAEPQMDTTDMYPFKLVRAPLVCLFKLVRALLFDCLSS